MDYVTHYANSIAEHFTIIVSSKVRKLRRERERPVSTVYCRSNDNRNRIFSDIGEISAVTVRLGQLPADCSMRIFSHLYVVP